MKKHFQWKDLGVAYSLATLFFIITLKELVFPGMNHYLDPEPHSPSEYLAVFTNVLLFTLIFAGLIHLTTIASRVWIRRATQLILFGLGVLSFGPLSYELMHWLSPDTKRLVSFPLPAFVIFICLGFAMREKFALNAITNNLKLLSLFLLPFSLLILLESIRAVAFPTQTMFMPESVQNAIPAGHQSHLKKKVVWIIFDELDFAAFTTAKQNNVQLPDFESFSDQSFVAQNAYSPNNRTQESIPALLTGKPLLEALTISSNDLMLYPSDKSEPFSLRESKDIFVELESLGGSSGIVGWYHPYPRIFGDRVSNCFWSPLAFTKCSGVSGFITCNRRFLLRALENVPFVTRIIPSLPEVNEQLMGETQELQTERNEYLTGKADELISNPKLDLLFFHFSIPHYPAIALTNLHGDENYFSSLEVANETLRRLRQTLEKKGEWENSVVIISSDHMFRFKTQNDLAYLPEGQRQEALEDRRIPFMVKFAGQKSRTDYHPAINTVITKRLIMEVFEDKVRSPEDFVTWLDDLQISHPELIKLQSVGPRW